MTEVDVEHQINAVERRLGTRIIDAKDAHVVTISQSYDTDQDDLWDAVTNIERIPRWLMPISGDLKVGGSYQLEGQAGGTVLTCDPPKNFTATWEFGGGISWIDVSVSSRRPGPGTLGDRAHRPCRRPLGTVRTGRRGDGLGLDAARAGDPPGHRRGHRPIVRRNSGSSPRTVAASSALSGEQWYAANVAFGTDPVAAREMAERCLAAYLGEEPN